MRYVFVSKAHLDKGYPPVVVYEDTDLIGYFDRVEVLGPSTVEATPDDVQFGSVKVVMMTEATLWCHGRAGVTRIPAERERPNPPQKIIKSK